MYYRLNKEIKTIEEDSNNLCIVMLDANESIDDRTGAIRKIMSETSLVDTFSQVAGNPGELATYTRGKRRIDYILTSQHLVPYVSRVGYLAFHESNPSDHRGLFVDISEAILDIKVRLTRPARRHIGSKSKPSIIYHCKQHIHKQFLIHHIYERASEIQRLYKEGPITPEFREKINRLDKQITEIILSAEKSQVPREHESDWSIAIHHQSDKILQFSPKLSLILKIILWRILIQKNEVKRSDIGLNRAIRTILKLLVN
jgi:hypothetical protein